MRLASRRLCAVLLTCALATPPVAFAQQAPPRPVAAAPAVPNATPDLAGRVIEEVRILGNRTVPQASIRNLIRSRVGERYDPATVEEDYQRIFSQLRKFSNVEARVEPTETGVIVVFEVSEQAQISDIIFRGNRKIDTGTLLNAVDVSVGQAIDPFRINLSRNAIEALYREKNYPLANVEIPQEPLTSRGELIFDIVEGPHVRVRNVEFKGAESFPPRQLAKNIRTAPWIFIFRPGRYDPEQIEEDVASLRRFYESKGFFDARVGRKIIWSPDLSEVEVDFLIDEGRRYTVERVRFEGNESLSEADLRSVMNLVEGRPFDAELLQRDIRQMVRAYSPFGYIYQPQTNDPDYLQIDARPVFLEEPGKVELVYSINEGKPFRVGQILVKGNYKSKDKLILRDMRLSPGDLYDSGKVQDAAERLRGTRNFEFVNITPIGTDPEYRALLVEVQEARTASFNIGAGVNSNGGIGGNISYSQQNFDIANPPDHWRDLFSDRSFTGAGQRFRISLEPGTRASNASIFFAEPWLFDQPYSFSTELYLRDRGRRNYDERHIGGRLTFGRRFGYNWSTGLTLRGEDVEIRDVEDPPVRAPEILEFRGHSTLTSVALQVRRDTVNPGFFPHSGTVTTAGVEAYGLLGGEFNFQKFTLGWDGYYTLHADLTDRKTVLGLHANAGLITGDSVFFERFYGGGIGSVRGFRFRGISPRSGLGDDPVGGEFLLTGTAELNFPLIGDGIRGVVFTDVGTVEEELEITTIRSSAGAGFRVILPFFGQAPLAVDFGFPITKDDEDDTQMLSFSFGFTQ